MRTVKIKNGIGFCARKGCRHLMSTSFEIIEKDREGKRKRKIKFALCEDCAFELQGELSDKMNYFAKED